MSYFPDDPNNQNIITDKSPPNSIILVSNKTHRAVVKHNQEKLLNVHDKLTPIPYTKRQSKFQALDLSTERSVSMTYV